MSRYESEMPVWAPNATGGWVKVVHRDPKDWTAQKYTTRVVRDSEDILLIANSDLYSTFRYWKVADMNPQFDCPDDIKWPDVIHIPTNAYD